MEITPIVDGNGYEVQRNGWVTSHATKCVEALAATKWVFMDNQMCGSPGSYKMDG
jgi:hypothetical protein